MHDTADLNKARQLLLVLPNLSQFSSVTSCRSLIDKHTGDEALSLRPGSAMPLGSELVLFNPLLSERTLGSDGTERTFGPPGGLDQRMWASGLLEFEDGKQLKRPAEMRKYIPPVEGKTPKARQVEEKTSNFGFNYNATRAALFRYSAATFNAHRIHLDPEYCRNEEGHPDCLVHGPLTATLLLNLIATAAKEVSGQVQKFEYRATSPLTVEQTVRLRGAWQDGEKKKASLWALNEAGTVCMTAKATLF